MALTHVRAVETADQLEVVVNKAKELNRLINDVLTFNSNQSIDWGAANKPAYLNEDVNGNLDGKLYTRQQLSNAIGSLAALQTTFNAGHIGNLNLVADANA